MQVHRTKQTTNQALTEIGVVFILCIVVFARADVN